MRTGRSRLEHLFYTLTGEVEEKNQEYETVSVLSHRSAHHQISHHGGAMDLPQLKAKHAERGFAPKA